MTKKEAKDRVEKLKKLINYHRHLYHVLDKQEISDDALDSLKKELFDLEQKYPEFITSDSPTQRIGGKPLEKFEKVKHLYPMLSFNDAFSEKDIKDWLARISKLLTSEEIKLLIASSRHSVEGEGFYCELKIDGLAIELIYEDGALKTGATRGDGAIGEDVTQNLKTIEAIPLRIREKSEIISDLKKDGLSPEIIKNIEKHNFKNKIILRGEAFIPKKEFEKANKEQEKLGVPVYANPRNLAAGSIRQLDPNITASRHLNSFSYELVTDFGQTTHEEKHKILKAFGFKTNSQNRPCRNLEEIFKFYKYVQEKRNKLSYEIDGIVIIINSNKIFDKLGAVGKAPRGAIAFKFPLKQAATIIEDIKVQVGRTGALTPIAVLKPVQIGGVMVSRATLHNEDEIKRLGIKIGDTVVVGRAGDVIPDIIKVLPKLRTGKEKEFKMPNICPACKSKIEKKPEQVLYYCKNPYCFAQQKEYFCHFVSRGAFNIMGLGPKIIERLIEEGLVSNPADLFELKTGDLVPLERFAEKSAENIINSIQKSKNIPFYRFIYALGIRNVGIKTSQDLSGYFKDIGRLQKSSFEDLQKIKDIGPVVAKAIYEWFSKNKNTAFVGKLKNAGIKIENPSASAIKNKLSGLTFVLTGALGSMSREAAKERIKELGGDTSEFLSSKTNFVVTGKDPGSKYQKAIKLGLKIIGEQEFIKLIK